MKLIEKYKEKYTNIIYKVYQLDNGCRVIHVQNPSTIDYNFSIVCKAGSCFEKQIGVPNGTAHFLEHLFFGPNKIFKDKESIYRFEEGSKRKPAIFTNGFTNRKYIYLSSCGNQDAKEKIIKRLGSLISFSPEEYRKNMNIEREIILSEKSMRLKDEHDPGDKYMKFLMEDSVPEFTQQVLGAEEDIKRIIFEDIEKYFNKTFTTKNCIIAIQSSTPIDKEEERNIIDISNKLNIGEEIQFRETELINRFDIETYQDKRVNGVYIEFNYFIKDTPPLKYKENVKSYLLKKLIEKVTFDKLREERGLVYDIKTISTGNSSFEYLIQGFSFITEEKKLKETLDEIYRCLYIYSLDFLDSKKGINWFNDSISIFIYPRTNRFRPELAEDLATAYIEGFGIYRNDLGIKEAKDICINDVKDILIERLRLEPHIWIEGSKKKKEYINIFKKTEFKKYMI